MAYKKISLLIMTALLCLLLCGTTVYAAESKLYSETNLFAPDAHRILSVAEEAGDAIVAVSVDTDGIYSLLRWKETSGEPAIVPLPVSNMEIGGIDIAPDGEMCLTGFSPADPAASGQVMLESLIVWLDASGNETARIAIQDDLPPLATKALPGKRIAIASMHNELMIYDETGTQIIQDSVPRLEALSVLGDTLYGFSSGSVLAWSLDTYEKGNSLDVRADRFMKVATDVNGSLYFIDDSGINQLDMETGDSSLLMDAFGTCLGDFNLAPKGFIALSDGAFALFPLNLHITPDEAFLQANNYVSLYRELPEIKDRTPFVITSVSLDPLTKTAASDFQRMHPELKVELRTFQSEASEDMPREDLVRTMNTELMAGGGGDVLLLDSLPLQSLASRGMLLDITHIADDVKLLPAIAASSRHEDGKVYAIPSAFSVFHLWGKPNTIEPIQALPDILDAPLDPGQMRLPMSAKLEHFYAACKSDFTNEAGDVQFQSPEFIAFLDFIAAAFSQIEDEASGISPEDRASMDAAAYNDGMLAFRPIEAKSFNDVDYYYRDGEAETAVMLTPTAQGAGQTYRPSVILGIPASAQNPSLSEAFIRLLLSDDIYLLSPTIANFSTVESKLDAMFARTIEMSNDNSRNVLYIMEKDGVRIQKVPPEAFFREMRTSFNALSIPYYDDYTILSFIEEEMGALMDGTIAPAEAAQAIEQRAFLYMNE